MSITTGINILMVLLGILIGASIMYGFENFKDWKEEQEELKKIEAEEYKRTHRNAGKPARMIPVGFVSYRNGEQRITKCKRCSLCGYLYTVRDYPSTCDDCGAKFKEERT